MRPSSPPLRRDSLPAGPHRRERRAARIQQRMSLRQRLPSGRSAPLGMSCGLCPAGRGLRRIASFWPAPSGNVVRPVSGRARFAPNCFLLACAVWECMRPVSGSARSAPRFLSGRPVRTAGNVMRPVSGRARFAPNCFLPSGPARTAGECGVACVRQRARFAPKTSCGRSRAAVNVVWPVSGRAHGLRRITCFRPVRTIPLESAKIPPVASHAASSTRPCSLPPARRTRKPPTRAPARWALPPPPPLVSGNAPGRGASAPGPPQEAELRR